MRGATEQNAVEARLAAWLEWEILTWSLQMKNVKTVLCGGNPANSKYACLLDSLDKLFLRGRKKRICVTS